MTVIWGVFLSQMRYSDFFFPFCKVSFSGIFFFFFLLLADYSKTKRTTKAEISSVLLSLDFHCLSARNQAIINNCLPEGRQTSSSVEE